LTQGGTIAQSAVSFDSLYVELWTSFASLLRSYTAAHGLHSHQFASVDSSNEKIELVHGKKRLILTRNHANVTWTRENGSMGTFELTISGHLRASESEEAMDLGAERMARELMADPTGTQSGD
jgi:hypothetical protein